MGLPGSCLSRVISEASSPRAMPGFVQDSRTDAVAATESSAGRRGASARARVVDACSNPLRVKTTFGIPFIGAAIGSVELGQ